MAYSIDVGGRTELEAIQNSPLLVSRSQHAQIQLHTAFEKIEKMSELQRHLKCVSITNEALR
jgi:hypothetical protein